jgi:hypothetical protein
LSYLFFEDLFFLKVSLVHLILVLKNYTTIIMLIKGVWVYKKSTASRLKRLPQGHPYKEPRALVFEATHRKPVCTSNGVAAYRWNGGAIEEKVIGSRATPIVAEGTPIVTISTKTVTSRG